MSDTRFLERTDAAREFEGSRLEPPRVDAWGDTRPASDDPELNASIAAVLELCSLKVDWNTYGAPPIDPAAIDTAIKVLVTLERSVRRAHAVPSSEGGVQLEWAVPGGHELEVYVRPNRDVEFTAVLDISVDDMRAGELGRFGPAVVDKLRGLADWLTGRRELPQFITA